MIKFKLIPLPFLVYSNLIFAGTVGSISQSEMLPSFLFIGLGGSYNSVKLDQYLDPLIGTTDIYSGTTLVASGSANGPATPFHDTQTTFAPEAQIGYARFFSNTDWLWGTKFSYRYLSITATDANIVAPQVDSVTSVDGTTIDFTGRATIDSVQTQVNHELDLIPFIGHSFKKSYAYLGIGPSLFGTRTNIYNITGYADIDGEHINVSGAPVSFSSSKWMWGGVAQIGLTYFIHPTWFLDINYTYAITPHNETNYLAPFSGTLSNGDTKSGTLFGTSTQYITVQAISVSMNKTFAI
ncbi:hypothetical protein [Legionella longbeachae]|uniref:hypothetical protein n=1 Tax=Legionella longbeachae TaxID=450 RepID=UPI0014050A17|nr:hypothetical protein [Legionella longbeachae]QIN31737.1 hypothetical protein GCB94_06045 [Legionella longbeachae]